MVSLFLGAGFSKWCMNLPLVNELFDFKISLVRPKDEIWLSKLQSAKSLWDQDGGSNNELFIKDVLLGSKVRMKKYLIKYLTRRLSEPFLSPHYGGGYQTFMFDDKPLKSISGLTMARDFLFQLNTDKVYGIITTNYDLVVEYSLGTKYFHYSSQGEAVKGRGHNYVFPAHHTPVILKGAITLSKIHGSLSNDGHSYWSSGICGLNGNANIVPPIPEKESKPELAQEWKSAIEILNNTSHLIVFGFNFNEYDTSILNLLKSNSDTIEKISIIDVESKINKASKIWNQQIISEYHINDIPKIFIKI